MAGIELTFIGSGNAFAPGGLCWNGFVLNRSVLFEAPPQALMALNRLEISPAELDAVVISHHHGDHFLGLPFLLLEWKHKGRAKPVRVIGPPRTEEIARRVCEPTYPGLFAGTLPVEWIEITPDEAADAGAARIEAVAVQHDPRLSLSLGFHVTTGGRLLGYTGDSGLCEGVLELARRADVLVSECASRDQHFPVHMNLVDDMPKVRAAMPAGAHLVLTHMGPGVDAAGLPNTHVARDFETLRF